MSDPTGPLTGVRIVEMTGIGPVPYAAMLLADMGADIIRIDRPGGYPALDPDLDFSAMDAASVFYRSRPVVQVDLKSDAGRAAVRGLIDKADAVIEGYRPGAMEALGLGPQDCLTRNPKLAFVRVTGWGQDGPMARQAGHDLNYIAKSGALSLFGRDGKPPVGLPPLVGDMASGALMAVIGLLSAVLCARAGGRGQVVDANIVDGSASLYTLLTALSAMGAHNAGAGGNVLDGGRYYYRTYACAEGGAVAVGAIEPAFRRILLERLNLADDPLFQNDDPKDEAARVARFSQIFASQPKEHWDQLFDGTDGCVTAILTPDEARRDPGLAARETFVQIDEVWQSNVTPRFSETPGSIQRTAREASRDDPGALSRWD
ncbi:CaiB/BaiF CoA transferase family protein [Pseudosulfitobacter koreensis]|uniref:CoA transferase n=1 Tax=Pseudosulfitobacter koreensis TaxID=2968472 RepID=A0ABT1YY25_9RHOB|nr:CaiB/BaiF CoA-transferase family protein [Pseudosulfitobacter koreense]MCR8825741.1 CoA transferase [Pseudosulfitobacter koreense]